MIENIGSYNALIVINNIYIYLYIIMIMYYKLYKLLVIIIFLRYENYFFKANNIK